MPTLLSCSKILKIVCRCRHVCHSGHVAVRGQFSRVNSLLPLQGSEESPGFHLYLLSHHANPNHIIIILIYLCVSTHKHTQKSGRSAEVGSPLLPPESYTIPGLPGLLVTMVMTTLLTQHFTGYHLIFNSNSLVHNFKM